MEEFFSVITVYSDWDITVQSFATLESARYHYDLCCKMHSVVAVKLVAQSIILRSFSSSRFLEYYKK